MSAGDDGSAPGDHEANSAEEANPGQHPKQSNVIPFKRKQRAQAAADPAQNRPPEKNSAEPPAEAGEVKSASQAFGTRRATVVSIESEGYLGNLLPLVDPDHLEIENQHIKERLISIVNQLHLALKGQPMVAQVLSEWEWSYFVEPERLQHPWGLYHSQEKLPSQYALLPFEFIRCVTLIEEIERINALMNRIGLLLSLPARKDNRQRRYELAIRGSWLHALKQRLMKDLYAAELALAHRYEPFWRKFQVGVARTMRSLVHKPKLDQG